LRRRGRGQSGGHQLKTDWAKQTGRGLLKYLQKGSFRRASWKTFADVKQTFGSADQVTVPNGYQVVVFNIGGGAFRLGKILGIDHSVAARILKSERAITIEHAKSLGTRFKMDPKAFLKL
jgi:mRNA-degrading endonuclease HigB of HigAB toxin-antitoxin module